MKKILKEGTEKMVTVFCSSVSVFLSCVYPIPPGKIPTLLNYFANVLFFLMHIKSKKFGKSMELYLEMSNDSLISNCCQDCGV